ncbi:MAG: sugar phosphate isomerase/epimerase [Firmicutes bacterium]|nr:sugar phosphate isomerase/epimerase [Bacillota bacterium]
MVDIAPIGLSSWSFLCLPPEKAIEKVHSMGFTCVELWADSPHFWPREYLHLSKTKELKKLLKNFPDKNSIHAPVISLADKNPGFRHESVKQVIETVKLAQELECAYVTIHPGYLFPGMQGWSPMPNCWQWTVEAFKEITAEAEKSGVILGIENVKGQIGSSPEEMIELLREINSPNAKITFDISHANMEKDSRIERFIELMPSEMIQMHLSDNMGEKDSHFPLGHGNIDFKTHIKALVNNGFCGRFIGEILWEEKKPFVGAEKFLKLTEKYLILEEQGHPKE